MKVLKGEKATEKLAKVAKTKSPKLYVVVKAERADLPGVTPFAVYALDGKNLVCVGCGDDTLWMCHTFGMLKRAVNRAAGLDRSSTTFAWTNL